MPARRSGFSIPTTNVVVVLFTLPHRHIGVVLFSVWQAILTHGNIHIQTFLRSTCSYCNKTYPRVHMQTHTHTHTHTRARARVRTHTHTHTQFDCGRNNYFVSKYFFDIYSSSVATAVVIFHEYILLHHFYFCKLCEQFSNTKILGEKSKKLDVVCYEYYLCSPKLMDIKFCGLQIAKIKKNKTMGYILQLL